MRPAPEVGEYMSALEMLAETSEHSGAAIEWWGNLAMREDDPDDAKRHVIVLHALMAVAPLVRTIGLVMRDADARFEALEPAE